MTINKSIYAFLGVALVCGSYQAFAGALDELKPADRATVVAALAGNQQAVSIRNPIDGSLWPEFYAFEKVKASPLEVAAVFADVENHKTYFSGQGITKSDILNGKGTSTVEVAYHLYVPLASDDYTCVDHLSSDLAQGTYTVSWDVMQSAASHAKSEGTTVWSHGSARFEPYEGGTLIAYKSLISPKDRVGASWGWVISGAEGMVKGTVDALTKQVQNEKASDATALQKQVDAFNAALAH